MFSESGRPVVELPFQRGIRLIGRQEQPIEWRGTQLHQDRVAALGHLGNSTEVDYLEIGMTRSWAGGNVGILVLVRARRAWCTPRVCYA